MLKDIAFYLDCIISPLEEEFSIFIVYSCLKQIANIIGWFSNIVIMVPSLANFTCALFDTSFETDIRFEHKLRIYRTLLKMIFCLILSTSVKNWTDLFSEILNVKSLLVERPIFGELYNINRDLFTKQLLAPELIKIRILCNVIVLVWSTICQDCWRWT